ALSDVGKVAVQSGLVKASGGNLSMKVKEDYFLITKTATWLDRLEISDFVLLDLESHEVCYGTGKPSTEYKIHSGPYRLRKGIRSVIHLHPQWPVIATALGVPIRPLTLDHYSYLDHVSTVPFYQNGSEELGKAVTAAADKGSDVVVMANHGVACFGDSPYMGLRKALNIEEAAKASVVARNITGK